MSMGGNMGGASFTITADTSQFQAALTAAETKAVQFGNVASAAINKFTVALPGMTAAMNAAATATHRFSVALPSMPGQLHAIGKAGYSSGQGILFVSQAVEDLQYGFSAIVNNIPMIVMGFGGSAGIAGAVSFAAVGIAVLARHFEELKDSFQAAWSDKTVEQLKATRDTAEAAAKAFEHLKAAKSEHDEKSQTELTKLIGNTGAENLGRQVTNAMLATGAGAQVADISDQFTSPAQRARNQMLRETTQRQLTAQMAQDLIGQTIAGGVIGANAQTRLQNLIAKSPGSFDKGFGGKFGAAAAGGNMDDEERQGWMQDIQKIAKERSDEEAKQFAGLADARKKIELDIARIDKEKWDEAEKKAKRIGDIEKEQDHEARTRKQWALEDQMEALEKQKRAINEAASGRGGAGSFGSAAAYISSVTQSAFQHHRENQAQLKSIDKRLEKIHDVLKNERRAAVFAPK